MNISIARQQGGGMSTVVCHQPCNEPHNNLVEATTMRLKLVAPKSIEVMTHIRDHNKPHNDFGGWSFLQSLPSSIYSQQQPKRAMENEYSSYCQPHYSSVIKLSQKSLELCTESLGSETGSDTISECESPIFSLPMSPVTHSLDDRYSIRKPVPMNEYKDVSLVPRKLEKPAKHRVVSCSFPPPLTTISGANNLQVRPHREGGRLIIQASEVPPMNSYLQAERSEGRLRLSFWPEDGAYYKCEEDEVKEEGSEGVEEEDDVEDMEVEMGTENDSRYHQRPSTCKEDLEGCHRNIHGGKGLSSNWNPFWVATS